MRLLGNVSWWATNLMLMLLLFRAWRGGLLVRFPYFFGYIGCVFCSTLLRLYLYWWAADPQAYRLGYWISESISVVFGFGVTWEIYARILAPYRGVGKMARTILGILLTAVLAMAILELWGDPLRRLGPTTAELEGNMRVVQALLLLALMGLIVQYAVPMGRNIRSMLVGYGFYIGCSAVTLSLHSRLANGFGDFLSLSQRSAYTITLAVWSAGMWSYSSNPAPDQAMECDYDRVSEQTIRALGQLRNHLIHSWRA
jgi:hypothetical protein